MLNACAEAHALAPLRFARAVEMWYFGSLASRSPIRQAGTRTGTTSSSDILQLVFTETELLAECQVLALHWCASSHQPGTKLITSFQPGIESRGLACQSTLKWSNNTINWTLFSCLHEMKKYAVIYGAGEAEGVEVIRSQANMMEHMKESHADYLVLLLASCCEWGASQLWGWCMISEDGRQEIISPGASASKQWEILVWSVQLGTGFGHILKKTTAAFKPGMIG